MGALTTIIAFIASAVAGLPVIAFEGDPADYVVSHPFGMFFVSIVEGQLLVKLAFHTTHARCAGDYLEMVRRALESPVPLGDGTGQTFTFDRMHYLEFKNGIDYHAAVFTLGPIVSLPVPANSAE